MPRKTRLGWAIILPLFGIGSALTVIYRQQPDIDPQHYLPPKVYLGALWLGIVLIALAILLSVLRFASQGLAFVWHEVLLSLFNPPRYQCRHVRHQELERHNEYWERFFPGEVSSLAQDRAWYRRNSKLFWFLFEVTTRRGARHAEPKLVGSFSIIPLTKSAALQVAREELVGATFAAEHIGKASRRPAAVYVGGVVAEGLFAKAAILARLSEKVERLQEKHIVIYTRPVTSDGLRLVKKYDFQPVSGATTAFRRIYSLGELDGDR